jgi:hypothetical protein
MKTLNTKTFVKASIAKSLLLTSVIAAGLFASAATAGDDLFTTLDVNEDGVIDTQEASAHEVLAASFASLDTDQNGVLTREEFEALDK